MSLSGRRILITGAAGSIGAELSRQVLDLGPSRLVLLDRAELPLFDLVRGLGQRPPVVPVLADAGDAPMLRGLLRRERIDTVLHAAAYKHLPMLQDQACAAIRNNVLVTRSLGRAARVAGVRCFLLISTDKAEAPSSVLGASKRLAEAVMQDIASREAGMAVALVRFGNVLGSAGSVLPRFAEQALRGGPLTLSDPRASRYFMTGPDAARLILRVQALARPGQARAFALDMGPPRPILSLAREAIRLSGRQDVTIRLTGLSPGEKMHEAPLPGRPLVPGDPLLELDLPQPDPVTLAATLARLLSLTRSGEEAAAAAGLMRGLGQIEACHQNGRPRADGPYVDG